MYLFTYLIFFLGLLMIMKKSMNILLFLLSIEVFMIMLSFFSSFFFKFYFIFILMLGVMEAIMGLSFMIFFIRFFGSDFMIFY